MKAINEKRLFELLPLFFTRPQNVLIELAQNSQRSGASVFEVSLNGRLLQVRDNGSGASNPAALVVLAESDWDETIEAACPAGWGLFYLMSLTTEMTFRSLFGELRIDCERYLSDAAYRENILDQVAAAPRTEKGFEIRAVLKAAVSKEILKNVEHLAYFPMKVIVNGASLKPAPTDKIIPYDLVRDYMGNQVYIRVADFPSSPHEMELNLATIWYGIPIKVFDRQYLHSTNVVLDVRQDTPVTPVLPYRTALREDVRLEEFYKFLRAEVVVYCTEKINGAGSDKTLSRVEEKLMETMGRIATKQELDQLDYFYYTRTQPYVHTGRASERVTIGRSEPLPVSFEIEEVTVIDCKTGFPIEGEVIDEGNLILGAGAFVTASLPDKRPSWLQAIDQTVPLRIEVEPGPFEGNMTWYKAASIKLGEEKLDIVGFAEYWGSVAVMNTKEIRDICDISEGIFEIAYYNSDGDTWDTQKDEFDRQVDEDLMKQKGAFSLGDLFDGFSTLLNILPGEISSVHVQEAALRVNLKDGSEKLVALG